MQDPRGTVSSDSGTRKKRFGDGDWSLGRCDVHHIGDVFGRIRSAKFYEKKKKKDTLVGDESANVTTDATRDLKSRVHPRGLFGALLHVRFLGPLGRG